MQVSLCYLGREELVKLENAVSLQNLIERHANQKKLDEEKFIVEYCKAVIKGWSGLKYRYLEELLLVDISSLDPEDELAYTQDNAELLMKNSNTFDTWVTEAVGDLENFTGNNLPE